MALNSCLCSWRPVLNQEPGVFLLFASVASGRESPKVVNDLSKFP